ncbi:PHB depolymerase family esterase [Nocardia sp. BMG51109]|uniref:alpha/beta hydrolase family esterase n=1 Tax=Nocardia sp. BMG51109 TaxID=1056816 RepID=UPI000464F344|nr:hypothetical protein [Nocardia sp. BMG51109]
MVVAAMTAAALLTAGSTTARAGEPATIAPAASPGCAGPAAVPGTSRQQFAAAGKSGSYAQDVPAADAPLPLVLDLHGYLEPAEVQRAMSGVAQFGIEHGFATVTPQIDEPGLPRWDFAENSGDITYLSDLITHVESALCVDQRRIYVTGLSMGAFTTSSLACRLADRIAAVAPVAGLRDFSWCEPARAIPVVAFHGTADPIVAYTGGAGPNARFLPSPDGSGSAGGRDRPGGVDGPGEASIPDNAAAWARRNGCEPEPVRLQVAADVTLSSYACPEHADVEFYSVVGGGHTWPGAVSSISPEPLVGTTTGSISANQIMWDFFRAHPLT